MSLWGWILLLVIASICGSLGARIAGASKKGCLGSIALGFIGSFIGHYLAVKFDLPLLYAVQIGGQTFPVVWSIIGSALFVALLNLIGGGRKD